MREKMKLICKKATLDVSNAGFRRKTTAQQLKGSELKYRRLFETAQDGILMLNGDTGRIVDANPFITEMLGYRRKELLGKYLWDIGAFKDINASKIAYLELQSENYIRYNSLPLETKDKRLINVEFVSNAYKVGGSRIIQCNVRDVTERSAQLEAANKELESFSYSVSHDLRLPLRSIDGWSLALQEDCRDKLDKQEIEYINLIRSEVQRMGRLIDDILMFLRQNSVDVSLQRLEHHEMQGDEK